MIQPQLGEVFTTADRDEGDSKSRVGSAFYGTPAVANGRVYVGSYQGFVYSMRAADSSGGRALGDVGSFEIDGDNLAKGISGSVVYDDGALIVVATEDTNKGHLYVLDAEELDANARQDRIERCRYPADDNFVVGRAWTTPLVVNRVAYFGDLDHFLHAVSIDTCLPVWDEPAELGGAIVSTPVAVNGRLYVGAFDRHFYSIDMASGTVADVMTAESWFWASPATDGRLVYAPNLDGRLYAYDTLAGQKAWEYDQEGDLDALLAKPAIVGPNIVLASDSGIFSLVDNEGRMLRRIGKAGDKVRSDLTVIGSTVYAHSLDELLTAYAVVNDDLESEWDFQIEGF
ncbi:MAG: PQQ-binding-like beta-propeller repeat protein [Chloroflexi bacterium]|nr:PQQ-binding-like beta-propeller repeat protein [Chloroflexota bacterium]